MKKNVNKKTKALSLLLGLTLALSMTACKDGGRQTPHLRIQSLTPAGPGLLYRRKSTPWLCWLPPLQKRWLPWGMEQLVNLRPDVLLVTNMSLYDQENPYQSLIDMGVCVACVPTSDSIEDIESDIAFVASVFGEEEKGREIIDSMQAEIDRIATVGETITDKKSVYFEIAAAPSMYSFGSGVFLNELLEIIGAENILASESGWLGVTEEAVVSADPDVILTNVNYIEDPVGEIKSRSGWEAVTAVSNGEVYYIDNMASSLPDQNVVKALREMAAAVYPEYYGE